MNCEIFDYEKIAISLTTQFNILSDFCNRKTKQFDFLNGWIRNFVHNWVSARLSGPFHNSATVAFLTTLNFVDRSISNSMMISYLDSFLKSSSLTNSCLYVRLKLRFKYKMKYKIKWDGPICSIWPDIGLEPIRGFCQATWRVIW